MSKPPRPLLRCLLGAGLLSMSTSLAAQDRTTYIDLQAGLGYSTNPLLFVGDSTGSAFGRISAYGFHGWSTERSSTSLTGYVENNTYFRRYSNQQLFNLNALTSKRFSPAVTISANLGFSGDSGGQLSSRFFEVPVGALPINQAPPGNALVIVNPDLAALNERQYRINAGLGGAFALSPRDALSTTLAAQRVFFSGGGNDLDYNLYDASAGYQRRLSERVSAGVRVIGSYTDYRSGGSITSYGPQATIDARLTADWQLAAAAGFVRTKVDQGPQIAADNDSIDLALDGSLCRNLEFERICARISRRTQSSVLGAAPVSSSISADYSRRLNARDQLQATLAVVRTGRVEIESVGGAQTFYSFAGSFDRRISDRLSAGVSAVARTLQTAGPNPKADLGGTIFVRHRFGRVR